MSLRIKRVENCKYLDIHINSHLKWDIDVKYVMSKTGYLLYIFSGLTKMNIETQMVIYYALIQSIALDCIIASDCGYKNVITSLKKLQKDFKDNWQ